MGCTNRFTILSDKAKEDDSCQGKQNSLSSVVANFQMSSQVDPELTQGVSPAKHTPVVTEPQVSPPLSRQILP